MRLCLYRDNSELDSAYTESGSEEIDSAYDDNSYWDSAYNETPTITLNLFWRQNISIFTVKKPEKLSFQVL